MRSLEQKKMPQSRSEKDSLGTRQDLSFPTTYDVQTEVNVCEKLLPKQSSFTSYRLGSKRRPASVTRGLRDTGVSLRVN